MRPEWNEFVGGKWSTEVNVRDFIQKNYHPYDGDESFLADATQNTKDLWAQVLELQKKEREAGGVLIWTPRLFLPLLLTDPAT